MSSGSAPAGGQSSPAPRPRPCPAESTPAAWRTQSASPARAWISIERRPSSSRSPTITCTSTSPSTTSGASSVSSDTVGQPVRSPAASASSTSAVPGTSTVSNTLWSAIHGWAASERRPVSSHSSLPASGDRGAEQRMPDRDQAGALHVARARAAEPVALALEGVGRELHAPRGGVQRVPVRGQAGEVGVGDQVANASGSGRLRTQGGRDGRVGDGAGERGQRAAGPDLDLAHDAERVERADAVGEAHGVAGVLDPVLRGGDLVAGQLAAQVGDDRDASAG